MNQTLLTDRLMYAEPLLCLVVLMVMYRRSQLRCYGFVTAFLAVKAFSDVVDIALLRMGGRQIEAHLAYRCYFYFYWAMYALEALLGFGIIYSIYNLAMAPLHGLQRLGRLMFRWAAGISIALAVSIAIGPHSTGLRFAVKLITQLQQTQGVLTLCMLLFVCLAIRPMGLSYRSKIFGVCLGLGVLATTDLAHAAWIAGNAHLVSISNIIDAMSILVTLTIWTAYFAMPEPRRRMIVLPTTSPFLRWNQISIALGDEPGFVALGEVHPEMFAPAEIEIMLRASAKMEAAAV